MRLGDVECDARHGSLRRYEQRLERSEKTTSDCPGTARMAIAADRARDRGASGDRRRLSESGRGRSASAGFRRQTGYIAYQFVPFVQAQSFTCLGVRVLFDPLVLGTNDEIVQVHLLNFLA